MRAAFVSRELPCAVRTTSRRFATGQRRHGGRGPSDNKGYARCASPLSSSGTTQRHFYDKSRGVCLLCDETLDGSYTAHIATTTHIAYLGVYDLALGLIESYKRQLLTDTLTDARGGDPVHAAVEQPVFCDGVPPMAVLRARPVLLTHIDLVDLIVRKWWRALQPANDATGFPDYHRLAHLSADQPRVRQWRLRYLLTFFKQRGVLRDSLLVKQGRMPTVPMATFAADRSENASGHSSRFERCEMIGDLVLKPAFVDRLVRLAECSEVTATEGFFSLHSVLDSNVGLRAAYDYLKMNRIVGTVVANNKAKADVVEAIVGELCTFLLATGPSTTLPEVPCAFDRGLRYLRALVEHFVNELVHTLLMWRLEKTLRNVQDMIATNAGWPELVSALDTRKLHASSVSCSSINRSGRAAFLCASETLPVLSALPHPSPLKSLPANEVWYYASHGAITRATAMHEAQRTLSAAPSRQRNALLPAQHNARPCAWTTYPANQSRASVEVDGTTGVLRRGGMRAGCMDATMTLLSMPDFGTNIVYRDTGHRRYRNNSLLHVGT